LQIAGSYSPAIKKTGKIRKIDNCMLQSITNYLPAACEHFFFKGLHAESANCLQSHLSFAIWYRWENLIWADTQKDLASSQTGSDY